MDVATLEHRLQQIGDNSMASQEQKHAGYSDILQGLLQSPLRGDENIAQWKLVVDSRMFVCEHQAIQ